MQQYFDKTISKYWCGFRKAFNAQHYLITMIENPRENVDKGDGFGALLTDLSKTFDCLPRELIIARLHPYDSNMKSLI